MKSLINMALAAVLIGPVLSHAAEALTHAQVRAELVQLEQAGYNPVEEDNYPQNVQHAQTILAQQNEAITAYGSDPAGTSQSSSKTQSSAK